MTLKSDNMTWTRRTFVSTLCLAAAADAGTVRERSTEAQLRSRLERVARADKRLLDAYEAGAISLPELSERRRHLGHERLTLER